MDDMLTQALELAGRGYHLFPLVSGGKTPALTGNWQDTATTDPRILERWFARGNCNIAIACEPSGIIAVDLDTAKPGSDGPDHGIETLRELAQGREIPRTLTVATPSGGTHLYYRQPADGSPLRNSARRLGPLIDTRGIGGYLVAPGSRINGTTYRITDDVPLAEIPGWITAVLRPPDRNSEQPRPLLEVPTGLGNTYARAALGRETARVATAKPGQRNHTLNQAAFSLGRLVADGILDRVQVEAQLTHAARVAGLGRAETEATLNSGITAGLERRHARLMSAGPALGTPPQAEPSNAELTAKAQPVATRAEGAAAGSNLAKPAPETLAALHTAFDALECELGERPAPAVTDSRVVPTLTQNVGQNSAAGAAELDAVVSEVQRVESRAEALARTPEWRKIRAIGTAAGELAHQIRQAARDHADDLRTDVYIHGAICVLAARTCRQVSVLASAAADRLAHRGLTSSPTYADLRAIHRAAQRAEAKLFGRAPGQTESEREAVARKQLKALRRDLRVSARSQRGQAAAPRPVMRAVAAPAAAQQHRP